jgi:ketosteroid isomerase-like protein
VVAIGVLVGSAASWPVSIDDAAEIRAARAEQNAAIASRNFDRVAALWVDDIQVTAGLGFTLRGRDAYRRAFIADSLMVYRREPDDVKVSSTWPLAWETGSWTGRLANQSGPPLLAGRYSAQWFKQDGHWRIRSELFVALQCAGVSCGWPARAQ